MVTLDGSLFEKSGTMSGGGSKPRGGKMGTSIRASVSAEAIANAEKELTDLVDELATLRQKIADASRRSQAHKKEEACFEMELAKSQKEVNAPGIMIFLDSLGLVNAPFILCR